MATLTRPELSKRNPYYINKERYFELKHFCLQYDIFVSEVKKCVDTPISRMEMQISVNHERIVEENAIKMEKIKRKILMIERAANLSSDLLTNYILLSVTKGFSCTYLIMHGMPCCKDTFYTAYRKFFYILDKIEMEEM